MLGSTNDVVVSQESRSVSSPSQRRRRVSGMADELGLVFGHDGFEHLVMPRLERPDEVGIIDCH